MRRCLRMCKCPGNMWAVRWIHTPHMPYRNLMAGLVVLVVLAALVVLGLLCTPDRLQGNLQLSGSCRARQTAY